MNPAQSFLLELKTVAIRQLPFEDAWKMFGVGVHPNIDELFLTKLAPFLSQGAQNFWSRKLYYFKARGGGREGGGDYFTFSRAGMCAQPLRVPRLLCPKRRL